MKKYFILSKMILSWVMVFVLINFRGKHQEHELIDLIDMALSIPVFFFFMTPFMLLGKFIRSTFNDKDYGEISKN